jgi:alkylhydroperoxidase/carboxymuconolactone decarboxylase family protein YurZ
VAIIPLKIQIQIIVGIFRFFFNLVLSGIKIVKDFYNESTLLQGLFKTLGNVAGFVGSAIRSLLETLGLLEEKKPDKPIKELAKQQKEVIKETKELNKEVPKLSNNITTFKEKAKETTLDSLIQELAILKIAGKDTSEQYTQLIEKAVKLKTSQDELSEAVKQVKLELENYAKNLNQANLETSELADTSGNELNKLFNGIQKDIGKTGQTFKGLPLLAVPSLDEINENVDLTKVNFENLGNVIAKIGGDFSTFGQVVFNAVDKINKINEKSQSNWEDYGAIVGDVFSQSANLAEENSALQKSLAVTAAIINTAVAATKVYRDLPFPLAVPAAIAIAGIGAAQIATILGAEDGVIGLNSSYNKKPGKTDKYPFLLAKGESVVNAQSTAKNRPYLEFINNGGNLSDVFGVMTNKIDGTNERLERLERALGKSVLTRQTFNLVVENRNKSKISGAVRV